MKTEMFILGREFDQNSTAEIAHEMSYKIIDMVNQLLSRRRKSYLEKLK